MIFLSKTFPENPNIKEIIRPLLNIESNSSIGDAFTIMMKDHVHLALVRDNEGTIIIRKIKLNQIFEALVYREKK